MTVLYWRMLLTQLFIFEEENVKPDASYDGGLMKNFVKAMNIHMYVHVWFYVLEAELFYINYTKTKEGIFASLQIWSLMHDDKFKDLFNLLQKSVWQLFKNATHSLLGIQKAENYRNMQNLAK